MKQEPAGNGAPSGPALDATGTLSGPAALDAAGTPSGPAALDAEREEALGPVRRVDATGLSAPKAGAYPQYGKRLNLDWIRFLIALLSIAILAFVVVAAFVTLWRGQSIDGLTRLLEIIFAPLIALVAAAVAFYYRSESRR